MGYYGTMSILQDIMESGGRWEMERHVTTDCVADR